MANLEGYAIAGRPIVFSVGSANVLAEFSVNEKLLKVEIAVVEKGGEGVIPLLVDVIEQAALLHRFTAIEWVVLARNCSPPNPKLMKVLERIGFEVRAEESGADESRAEFYWQRRSTSGSLLRKPRKR